MAATANSTASPRLDQASSADQVHFEQPTGGPHRPLRDWLAPADRKGILAVMSIAIVARIVLILSYSPVLSADSGDYIDLAHRLAGWNFTGWQARRTPVYSVLLLAVHYSLSATWVLQAVMGVLATLLVYALIRILGGSTGAAVAGSLLYGASLEVMAVEQLVLTESLTSFLTLVATVNCALLIRRETRRGRQRALVGGAAASIALLCLTRPEALPAMLILVVVTARAVAAREPRRSGRRAGRATVVLCAGMLAPAVVAVLAWSSFNASTAGTFTSSSILGYNMVDTMGQYVTPTRGPDATITSVYAAWHRKGVGFASYAATPEIHKLTGLGPAKLSGRYLRIALKLIIAHPLAYIAHVTREWAIAWRQPNYADSFRSGWLGPVTVAVWGVERVVQSLVCLIFLAVCAIAAIARLGWSRARWLDPATEAIAATVLVGSIVEVLIGYNDSSRHVYPYLALVICVAFAAGGGLLKLLPGGRR